MPLDFRRVATRTGGAVNVNTIHHLGVLVDQLSEITPAARLSGHGLTLNSTAEGQMLLEAINRLARAEQAMLQVLQQVGGGARIGNDRIDGGRLAARPVPPVIEHQPRQQALPAPRSLLPRFLGGK